MAACLRKLGLASVVLLLVASAGQATQPLLPEEGERLIQQLGDPVFARREQAELRLLEAGFRAGPFLLKAVQGTDQESANRAKRVIEKLRERTPPGTPKEVAELLKVYQVTPWQKRQNLSELWMNNGRAGFQALIHLAWELPTFTQYKGEEAPSWRMAGRMEFGAFARYYQEIVNRLLVAERHDELEQFLEITAPLTITNPGSPFSREYFPPSMLRKNYAFHLWRRDKLEGALARHRPWADKKEPVSAEIVANLLIARGDLAQAQRYAEIAKNDKLVRHLRQLRGRWQELLPYNVAEGPEFFNKNQKVKPLEELGLKLTYHRLAGDTPGLEKAVAELLQAASPTQANKGRPFQAAVLLILNDRVAEAFALLKKYGNLTRRFELLQAQARPPEAFKLVEQARSEKYPRLIWLERARFRALAALGEMAQVEQELSARLAALNANPQATWKERYPLQDLPRILKLNRLLFQKPTPPNNKPGDPLEFAAICTTHLSDVISHPYWVERYHPWWNAFRKIHPQAKGEKLAEKVRLFVKGKLPEDELEQLVANAHDHARRGGYQPLWELAEVGEYHLPREVLEKWWQELLTLADSDSRKTIVYWRQAEVRRRAGAWREAAEAYLDSWKVSPDRPQNLFLSGWCLEQAGDSKEGKRRRELAHSLLPRNHYQRLEFASYLADEGFSEAAFREYEFALFFVEDFTHGGLTVMSGWGGTGSPPEERGWGTGALQSAGLWHLAQGRYAQARECFERVRLLLSHTNFDVQPFAQYLLISQRVHLCRVLELLTAKQFAAAEKELAACRAFLPSDVNLCVAVVPVLDRLGRKEQADRLFEEVYATWHKLATDYPRYAAAHHNLAWLAARCGRQQKATLPHGEQAVKLIPERLVYQDTLAELHFQLGQHDQAENLARSILQRKPHRHYHQAQLARIKAGDRQVPLPSDASVHQRGSTLLLDGDTVAEGPVISGNQSFGD